LSSLAFKLATLLPLLVAKNFRIKLLVPETLKIAIRESTKVNCKSFDELVIDLCNRILRPQNFQANYQLTFNGEYDKIIDYRVSEDARIKFFTFAAVFKNSCHTLDYLINAEKNSRIGRVISS